MAGRSYRRRRRLRVKAIVGLCAFLVGLTAIIVFSYNHFIVNANTVPASKSASSQTSTSSADKTAVLASSASDPSSSVVKPVQVSLTEAKTPLWLHVSIEDQTVTVYDADNQVVESWLCSTGSPGYDTPMGTFSVYYRCKYFWNDTYQEGAEYAVEFVQNYYLHSVPLDKNNNIIQSIADDLGKEDSHGCVHLAMENSKWIYNNIPNGTKVVVD